MEIFRGDVDLVVCPFDRDKSEPAARHEKRPPDPACRLPAASAFLFPAIVRELPPLIGSDDPFPFELVHHVPEGAEFVLPPDLDVTCEVLDRDRGGMRCEVREYPFLDLCDVRLLSE